MSFMRRQSWAMASWALMAIAILPAQAAFRRLEITEVEPCNLKLARLKDVPYTCWQFQDRQARLPLWKTAIGFSLGQISLDQWQRIAAAYSGDWRASLPEHDPTQHYWLMDFMPPLMQALNRHRFESQQRWTKPRLSGPLDPAVPPPQEVVANCWGTLYELLRLRQSSDQDQPFLFMVDAHQMLAKFQQISDPVKSAQPGDFLLISHRHGDRVYLDHGVWMIDEGLVFEKAGSGDAVPYRVTDLATLEKIWRPGVFDYELRRLKPGIVLDHPAQFGAKQTSISASPERWTEIDLSSRPSKTRKQYFSIFPLPLIERTEDRFHLPAAAYDRGHFQKSPIPTGVVEQ
ncbi:hypothetical protein [Lyngbya confervoides]|uniref:Lipoprotein n=1 Tax=Lyngbya confervoides BDU141951 TaxID=1574623 RepID=A0ABD4T311_9CYAN|nr:hypothetical protein [Lyngbya confervoides]MCM1982843.1 hypothetical protein [Lyngbya confervoides BDU141951]